MQTAKTDQTGRDAQANLSLCWVHSHFVGFVMSRLIFSEIRCHACCSKIYFMYSKMCMLTQQNI